MGDEISYTVPLDHPKGIALSDSEKSIALTDILITQFQPVIDPSVPAVIGMLEVALRSYFLIPDKVPQFTNYDEVHEATRGLKVSNAPCPNGILNRALRHLPK